MPQCPISGDADECDPQHYLFTCNCCRRKTGKQNVKRCRSIHVTVVRRPSAGLRQCDVDYGVLHAVDEMHEFDCGSLASHNDSGKVRLNIAENSCRRS